MTGYRTQSAAQFGWRKAIVALFAGLFAAFLAACGPPQTAAPVSNAPGDKPTIVSLNPCLDAILVELAGPDQVLALSHYSRDPASSSIAPDIAARYGVTGGTAEEILALKPDLVAASTFIAPSTKAALQQLGLRVETFGSPASLDESLAQIKRLAQLSGQSRAGKALEARIMRAVPSFGPQPRGDPSQVSAMVWQPGQIVAGETSLVWEHLARFALANHAAQMGLGQADHVTLEAILANPPDLLLVAGDAAGQTHPLLEELDNTRIARFEPELFYCGGPSMPKAWERLEQIRLDFALNPPGHNPPGHNQPGHMIHDESRHAH